MTRIRIRWWGHSCFEIIREEGEEERLLIDPHDGASIGLQVPRPLRLRGRSYPKPHYILVTHNHFDHNAVDAVRGEETREVVVERVGEFTLGSFRVRGVKLPHDEFGGKYRGFVTAYRIEVDGLSITHLSDAGVPPSGEEAEKLKADIVIVPAGGVYTMHPREAVEALDALGARIGIPMHYWLRGYFLPLDPIDEFLSIVRKKRRVVRIEGNEVVIEPGMLPSEPSVYLLEAPRDA